MIFHSYVSLPEITPKSSQIQGSIICQSISAWYISPCRANNFWSLGKLGSMIILASKVQENLGNGRPSLDAVLQDLLQKMCSQRRQRSSRGSLSCRFARGSYVLSQFEWPRCVPTFPQFLNSDIPYGTRGIQGAMALLANPARSGGRLFWVDQDIAHLTNKASWVPPKLAGSTGGIEHSQVAPAA